MLVWDLESCLGLETLDRGDVVELRSVVKIRGFKGSFVAKL